MANKLNEEALKKYINEAISEEMDEILGLSRGEKNAKWGYEWDKNLSKKQNRKNRRVNKAQILAAGYKNYDEYAAGEGLNEPEGQEEQPETQEQIPADYPYKSDRQKTGQFQTWFNQNMGGRLVVDGIWGPRTEAAYQQWLAAQNEQ